MQLQCLASYLFAGPFKGLKSLAGPGSQCVPVDPPDTSPAPLANLGYSYGSHLLEATNPNQPCSFTPTVGISTNTSFPDSVECTMASWLSLQGKQGVNRCGYQHKHVLPRQHGVQDGLLSVPAGWAGCEQVWASAQSHPSPTAWSARWPPGCPCRVGRV